jgi:hypothetical protein
MTGLLGKIVPSFPKLDILIITGTSSGTPPAATLCYRAVGLSGAFPAMIAEIFISVTRQHTSDIRFDICNDRQSDGKYLTYDHTLLQKNRTAWAASLVDEILPNLDTFKKIRQHIADSYTRLSLAEDSLDLSYIIVI